MSDQDSPELPRMLVEQGQFIASASFSDLEDGVAHAWRDDALDGDGRDADRITRMAHALCAAFWGFDAWPHENEPSRGTWFALAQGALDDRDRLYVAAAQECVRRAAMSRTAAFQKGR